VRPWLLGTVAACAATATLVILALNRQDETARCPEGLSAIGARCCGLGQSIRDGYCSGNATACAANMMLVTEAGQQHCQYLAKRVPMVGGQLSISPSDWEAEGVEGSYAATVSSFELDDSEVTWGRYLDCFQQGPCKVVILPRPKSVEPGLPLSNVSPEQATQICSALGGRLPTGAEWLFAAAGAAARRFAWGTTGLVCRRAAFGLVEGPCAHQGSQPELAGARPDGASELGIHDLAGNVAEWTREPSGFRARGGSFRSTLAGQLKSWSSVETRAPSPDIGFRCAYDQR
jgi:formylglycine-generating enzyme required for sulfatase activity